MPPLRSHADGAFASPTIGTGAAEKSAFRPALLGAIDHGALNCWVLAAL